MDQYEATIFEDTDRRLFDDFKQQRTLYAPIQSQIFSDLPTSKATAAAAFSGQLTPIWEAGRTATGAAGRT